MATTAGPLALVLLRSGNRGVGHQHSSERRVCAGQRDSDSRRRRFMSRNARRWSHCPRAGRILADQLVGRSGARSRRTEASAHGKHDSGTYGSIANLFDYTRQRDAEPNASLHAMKDVYAVTASSYAPNGHPGESAGNELADRCRR